MNTQPHHYEVGGDSRESSCMALYRKIFSDPKIQKIVAGCETEGWPKAEKPARLVGQKTIGDTQRQQIRRLSKKGHLQQEIACAMGCSISTVNKVLKRSRARTKQ